MARINLVQRVNKIQVLEAAAREEIAKINSEQDGEDEHGGGHAQHKDNNDDDDDDSGGVVSEAALKAEAEALEKEAKVREISSAFLSRLSFRLSRFSTSLFFSFADVFAFLLLFVYLYCALLDLILKFLLLLFYF